MYQQLLKAIAKMMIMYKLDDECILRMYDDNEKKKNK